VSTSPKGSIELVGEFFEVRAQVDRDLTTVSRVDRRLGLIKNLGRHSRGPALPSSDPPQELFQPLQKLVSERGRLPPRSSEGGGTPAGPPRRAPPREREEGKGRMGGA
jgi:hypothetical protein